MRTDGPVERSEPQYVPDTEVQGLLRLLPAAARPYALLARFDRPIGWWLLFWPGAWAIALAGGVPERWTMLLWFLLGSIAMRGAGCVYNDIVDRDLDAQVARTASRPIASGAVSLKAAWAWLLTLCLVGLIVLLQLRWQAQIVALASLALVAAYPFMKRITWWPQAWLGLVFTWAAPVGWVEISGGMSAAGLLLYGGAFFWVIAYDTIYALQDKEDDALVGIRSSALALGQHVRAGVGLCFALALLLWGAAVWQVVPHWLSLLALAPLAVQFLWQVGTLREDGADPLVKFRSNRFAGLLMFAACLAVGSA
ncbi:MAG: 4-hydroxybenzoate octaprenyltransferase [Alphaproteobacteria bacterium]|nr:4-hydroxybenzoate octaprenyltransferase [Alphaproteobacteria bacterium]MBU0795100.1 4-hydroxybenzoate octaprenyltransferase [Alphaproteobacteria bacterium]MBU0875218.1 4-hydroxybenzoate octaprenyltransferase [Alphaproteobacteria bacterium]MBU1768967.1 4-hydroxybenzoate octaprenyltransferase [Alphaproteobacteria bacterium]